MSRSSAWWLVRIKSCTLNMRRQFFREGQGPGGDVLIVPHAWSFFKCIIIATCLVRFTQGSVALVAMNTSPEPIISWQATTIATAAESAAGYAVPLCSYPSVLHSPSDHPPRALSASIASPSRLNKPMFCTS